MPETLHLTVATIDRYLSRRQTTRKSLQLVGVTAMLVAAKYEEIWAPEVRDFVYISDRAYTREQILACEKGLLNELAFELTVPTAWPWLGRLAKAAGSAAKARPARDCAAYLCELGLVDAGCLRFCPRTQAAAAVYLSLAATLGEARAPAGSVARCPPALLAHARMSSEADLLPCARALATLAERQRAPGGAQLQAVFKKYSAPKYSEVATGLTMPRDCVAPAEGA